MNEEEQLQKAIAFAMMAHKGQKDKAGNPFILHPIGVMMNLEKDGFRPKEASINSRWMHLARIVALWHDIPEDTEFSVDDCFEISGIELSPLEILDVKNALHSITYDKNISHEDYIRVICAESYVSEGLALFVKKADIAHNSMPERTKHIPEPDKTRLREKYDRASALIEMEIIYFNNWFHYGGRRCHLGGND